MLFDLESPNNFQLTKGVVEIGLGDTIDAVNFSAFMLVQILNAYKYILPHSVYIHS